MGEILKELFVWCKASIAMVWTSWISFLIWAVGGFDEALKILFFLMAVDFITGIWIAYKIETINSTRAYKGLTKKAYALILISCSAVVSKLIPNLGIRDMVIIFYTATEILSIIENGSRLGVPIPAKLKKALEQCRGDTCNSYCKDVESKPNIDVDLDKEIK
ncbi:MAG: phage holin family protein [Fusobacterium gastrosuis]|uniref:phage holin family protein n=1 Tax=Fusobacterium gastrosuis TaxID=1755100 RepID=UPI002A85D5CE|nr:phage holin family protein [Fusobacterium gastrosuis]